MPFVKELVIHGFKSFARETKIPFRETMNVIVGPNGSGKSNVTDAICFVLGRLGSKSMRAKRLTNLIFAGTKKYKPANEASVELIFDNSDKGFSLNEKEVKVKRILRRRGQSVYKINDEVRTRQEIIELLAQAGIDPNGFNIVLQGEIDSFVKMQPDKRREVIEEVAGISIYEIRKQRSLKELDKTEQKLKEVAAILRERTAYLRNLEQERKAALRFKKLQQDIKDYKASIFYRTMQDKQLQVDETNKKINVQQKEIAKVNELIDKNTNHISLLNEKINNISENIQKQSGLQQEKLNSEISDLRADLAGLSIRKQNLDTQVLDMGNRKRELKTNVGNLEQEIQDISKTKGKGQAVKENLEEKKKKLESIDEQKRKLYMLKSQLSALNNRIEDKQSQVQKTKNESDFTLNRMEQIEIEIQIKENLEQHQVALVSLKSKDKKLTELLEIDTKTISEKEKTIAALERQLQELDKIKDKVSSLDICPLCKTKMTKDHISKVVTETEEHKTQYMQEIKESTVSIKESTEKTQNTKKQLEKIEQELATRSKDILRLELINEKKITLKRFSEETKVLEREQTDLETKKDSLERQISTIKSSEENYDALRLDVQELERQNEKTAGMEATLKQRDVERIKNIMRQVTRELEESEEELEEIEDQIDEKQTTLEEKNEKDRMLKDKFKKILQEKNQHQEKIRFFESDLLHKQNNKHSTEEKVNNLKIERAQYAAQKEAIEGESKEFKGGKIMRIALQELRKRLDHTQNIINNLGTVNMRALEVYEDVKKEYDKIQEKADLLVSEKEEIMKVIEDIDKKKRKVFIQTLRELNELFSRNFSQLSTKGIATLEPSNKEDLFEGGIDMLIKVGKGKYFDTQSLSGGEQSLVSLALIFAIQEYKPYCFYIFDEIDAALDRRNSERLAMLLRRYMKNGQYIIITHNDSLITEAPIIYGVSMQDKISKVLSLEV